MKLFKLLFRKDYNWLTDMPRIPGYFAIVAGLAFIGVCAFSYPGKEALAMQDKHAVAGPYLAPKDVHLDPNQKLVDSPPVLMSMGTGMYSAVTIVTRGMKPGETAEKYTVYTVDADGKRTPEWHIFESRAGSTPPTQP